MKSSPSPTALSVEFQPSRVFCFALSSIALLALAAIFYADTPLVLRIVLAAGALLYARHCLRAHSRQRGRLQWREGWVWHQPDGVVRVLQLSSATLWPGVIVLCFRGAESNRYLTFTLWRDSLDSNAARQLRVCLRHLPVFGT